MRIWSIHPRYLDTKGLVALWRETLLAQHVLAGLTKGYTYHPQLYRFKETPAPLDCINAYLYHVWLEAQQRGYKFDNHKIGSHHNVQTIYVTTGQIAYERNHLLQKLALRDPKRFVSLEKEPHWNVHPLFTEIDGPVANWEIA